MQFPNARAVRAMRVESRISMGPIIHRVPLRLFLVVTALCVLIGASATSGWALQRHTLPGQSTRPDLPQAAQDQPTGAPQTPLVQGGAAKTPETGPAAGHGAPTSPPGPAAHSASPQATPLPGAKGEKPELHVPGKEEVHAPGAGKDAHAEHGVKLPEISPIPGVTFVETIIKLMDYELHGRLLGWRPNDLVIGRFTDDVNNYQLGVLEAIRFTTFRLKDTLSRMGDADAYDQDLEAALNLFMNRSTRFWFPSAEGSYDEANAHLRKFVAKLQTGQRNFYYRVDNLRSLISVYKDLLGNINRTLIMSTHADGTAISWFEVDDRFYYAKGMAHVFFEILKVVRVGFKSPLETIRANEMMDEILHELHRVELMDPWMILDGTLDGMTANHRANLNAPLSEVTHLLTIMSQL